MSIQLDPKSRLYATKWMAIAHNFLNKRPQKFFLPCMRVSSFTALNNAKIIALSDSSMCVCRCEE